MAEQRSRRRLSPAARREQLVDTMLNLAAGGEIGLVSVQDIAVRAGVSEGLLYHYFPTKQALVTAAVSRAAQALLTDLQAAVSSGDSPSQQLEAGLTAYLHHVQAQPTGWRALLAARTGDLADLAVSVEQQAQTLVLQVLGVQEPSPALQIALAGWTAFERDACLVWLDQPSVAIDTLKALLYGTFTAALVAAAEHDEQSRQALVRLTEL